ncbi:unnamed protein product [Urochloa decumbens]|uniref:F-box domain-containing protein n=1 Tax=Urochloa decumbens TaxID=240449 RepID=A0ABC9BUZ5_9POAL
MATSSPWSLSLPQKIVAAVLRRLPSHADRVRFAAVCRAWRAAAARHPLPPLPWLALPDGTFFSFPSSAALRFPVAAGGGGGYQYHGSCDDWLLFNGGAAGSDGEGYLLANPFTGATAPPRGATVRKLAMCSGGRLVAALVGDGRLGKIAMCRVAGSSWVMSGHEHDAWRGITDMAFYEGKVYAVEDTGDLFAMPTGVDPRTDEPTVAWARCVVKASGGPRRRKQKQAPPPSMRYLFVHGGRLMMVHRTTLTGGEGDGGAAAKFAVFAADLVSARWSEVASVGGDTALFVGRWRSLARRVSMYGMPGNRIQFLDDDRGCPGSFGSYDMGDGKTYPLFPTLDLCNGVGDTPTTWLFPRDEEVVSRWCDLPADVLGLVVRGLRSREDRLNLRVVCRDWCASTRQHLRRRPGARPPVVVVEKPLARAAAVAATMPPPPPPAVAYLVLPNGSIFGYPDLTPRRHDKKSPAGGGFGGYIGAAGDDWLLFHDDGGLFRLTSPITGETRLLPSFHGIRAHAGPVELVNDPVPTTHLPTATAAQWRHDDTAMSVRKLVVCPDHNGGGGFVYAAAIFGREHFAKVTVCSLETFSWSHSAGDRWRWYDDLAFAGGRLYAITAREDLLAFDVGFDGDAGGAPFVARVERVIEGAGVGRPCTGARQVHYLVPSGGGELLMVRRRFPHAGGGGASRFEVLRADLEEQRWEAVRSLGYAGEEALFVSRLCSRVVRGRHLRGDEIFFLPDDCAGMSFWGPHRRRGDHHAAVYDMWAGTVTYLMPRQPGDDDDDDDDGHTMATWLFDTSATTARRGTLKYK